MTEGRALHWFRIGGFAAPPAPPISVGLQRPLPAWAVRLAAAAVAAGCVASLADDRTRWVIGGMVILMLVLRPAGGAPTTLTLLASLWILVGDPFTPALFPVLFGTHLVIVLTSTVGTLPWNGQLELSTLRKPLLRMLAVQAVAQTFALAALWIEGRSVSSVWFQVLGATGIAFLAWVLYQRMRETR